MSEAQNFTGFPSLRDGIQTPDQRPVLFDREALIAALEGHEGFRALRDALDEAEKEFTEHITTMLLKTGKAVDQRRIDFTRGYFAGARHYVGGRVEVAKTRLALQPEADPMVDPRTKESDSA